MNIVAAEKISIWIDGCPILRELSFSAQAGEFIGLIGPNGSGKSTLLRMVAGLTPPSSGQLKILGRPIAEYKSKQLARIIGYVPQDTSIDFDFSVREIVLMGRHPHLSRFGSERQLDRIMAQKAMQQTTTLHLADRMATTLSGGQRQMVLIAKALAQDPQLLLLDEPISALDIRYQLYVLELMRKLTGKGITAMAALHDLNLAARFCDRLVLLHQGEILSMGKPDEVLTPDIIQKAYDVHANVSIDPLLGALTVTALGERNDFTHHNFH
ncbi:ABC transporter ATP-binding protein [Brevibacillus porteri]|uniref:Iron ABC transporter ATP-binding protein n=1 Tax=Brevibacillus porteri TaxID=2126350 RepID=A0ABX5FTE5_9BACL|nr:ABC transporter ATP-binding protein [Brevibacillus porteri]MED1797390.1 ABC transporter ATP-binding protein [Brevibacillus porteri]MED2129460.1 ABC transporter ATP-binding protein [Brevibacillus porteri]MED2747617.1 ABC transporter ATP-binding protein [Brevibacillus porteri]MED2815632.1 ABC transporter ATP-binding protein [Brevibacillus porteri]MED2896745.1 ABC transporter ATP-binding protein [Brevibacillus porteri]